MRYKGIDAIKVQLEDVKKCNEEYILKYQKANRAREDLLHMLEEYKYSASEGSVILKQIRKFSLERRKYKDLMSQTRSLICTLGRAINLAEKAYSKSVEHTTWTRDVSGVQRSITDMNLKKGRRYVKKEE